MTSPTPTPDPSLKKTSETTEKKFFYKDLVETKLARKEEFETTCAEEIVSPLENAGFSTSFSPNKERYQLLEVLGEGGMGIVQNVQDQWLLREVALKTLNRKKLTKNFRSEKQKTLLWRLQQEAFITAFLEHPNIVPIYDFEQAENGDFYFTMRKVEGKTFHQILKQNKRQNSFNEQKTLAIFLKVCDAIAYAHSRGVIHRDLKPDNIMVGEFGEVYVMDWGIAKCLHQPHLPENFQEEALFPYSTVALKTIGGIGTPGYMPPEQKQNIMDAIPQSDIYALGRILRECYILLSPVEEFRYILEQKEGIRPNQIGKKIPPDIEAIVKKATQENYQQRYPCIEELKEDLERYLSNALVNARKYTLWEVFRKWLRRHKRAISLTGLVFSIFFCTYLFFKRELQKEQEHVQQQKKQAFQKIYQEAFTAEKQAENISSSHKTDQEQKMRYLMWSLDCLNKASILSDEEDQIQQSKIKIGKKLIDIACQIGEYKLAAYVANDIQLLQDFVKEEQQRTLKTYHAKLDTWEKELQKPIIFQWDREEALLDIAKMQDEEIFKRLIGHIEKGTEYFLEENQAAERSLALDRFYTLMAEALGSFRDPKSRGPLLNALEKMSLHLSTLPESKRSPHKHQYMITLCKSLLFSESKPVAQELQKIRERMGKGNFWQHSQEIYIKLVENEKTD